MKPKFMKSPVLARQVENCKDTYSLYRKTWDKTPEGDYVNPQEEPMGLYSLVKGRKPFEESISYCDKDFNFRTLRFVKLKA